MLLVQPRTIDLGAAGELFDVSLANTGGGFVTVLDASVAYQGGAGWLSATLIAAPPGAGISHATLRLQADRSGLAPGSYGAVVTVSAESLPPVTVDLLMSVGAAPLPDYTVYVLVVEAHTLETIEQAITELSAGYGWSMPQVPPGEYLLVAGTDADDDGFIGDEAEPLFGMWPNTVDPVVLVVAEGAVLPTLDFSVGGGTIGTMAAGAAVGFRRL
jgi:serine protease